MYGSLSLSNSVGWKLIYFSLLNFIIVSKTDTKTPCTGLYTLYCMYFHRKPLLLKAWCSTNIMLLSPSYTESPIIIYTNMNMYMYIKSICIHWLTYAVVHNHVYLSTVYSVRDKRTTYRVHTRCVSYKLSTNEKSNPCRYKLLFFCV